MLPLTEASLAARDAAIDEEALTGAGDTAAAAALHSLIDAEASFQRREHLAALQREFNRLEALSAKDASGWDQRRQAMAACAVQAAWRRQTTRRGFRRAVAESLKQRREQAVTLIQHAQRTRRRVVHEAAAPVAKEEVEQLTRRIGARTLAMAQELQAALDAQLQAQAAGEPLEALPTWLDAASWMGDLSTVGGSALVHQLRDAAARGLSGEGDPQEEVRRKLLAWPQQRTEMQASVVRRQMMRTQAASLHAQLLHPMPLPPVPPMRDAELAEASLATPLPPIVNPAVQATHRRALQHAKSTVEAEEALRGGSGGGGGGGGGGGAEEEGAKAASARLRGAGGARMLQTLEQGGIRANSLSAEELLWLSTLQPGAA